MKDQKRRGDIEVIEHWYSLVARQQFSSREIYDEIEDSIAGQKMPGLDLSRIDLSEGGALSDKREYLRMKRERIVFDVCAAPVGVNYFFSYRFYALPAVVKPWEMIVFLAAVGTALHFAARAWGSFLGPFVVIAVLGFLVWLARNAIGLGLRDLDATLLNLPVIGPIYERYLRKDTFYRQDMRLAYGTIVSGIVKQEIEAVTAAKGVELVREFSYSPVFDGLYTAREKAPRPEAAGTRPE